MGAGKYIQETFEKEMAGKKDANYNYKAAQRERLLEYRKDKSAVVRVDHPTNPPRAHALGYKAKKGFILARARIRKGGGKHDRARSRRKPKKQGTEKLTMKKNIQTIAEGRAGNKFKNCEVLNSYLIGEDGKNKYFEVILVDPSAPEIKADKTINWICSGKHHGRAERGLTSAGKRARGLRGKGRGYEKVRPGAAAHLNRLK